MQGEHLGMDGERWTQPNTPFSSQQPRFHLLQIEWCEMLLSGAMRVEVRGYPLPENLGPLFLLVSTSGPDGQASLGDVTEAGSDIDQYIRYYCKDIGP